MVADIDAVIAGLLAGGGGKSLGLAGPVIYQKLRIVTIEVALVPDVQGGSPPANGINSRQDLRA